MRPARKGPENHARIPAAVARDVASMRPARKGPENRAMQRPTGRRSTPGFNEAGPQGAGKPRTLRSMARSATRRFNEAGPQGAGKPPNHHDVGGLALVLQ